VFGVTFVKRSWMKIMVKNHVNIETGT